ncbi:hypothetical protein SELMODRAFT_402754 [Selaginella moellendorffii]|uniref:Uncharacterized protein n=1 Tax=Selaginella moellendorffii TaxID=88036 RepID=D8QMY5_SELML|nr:hypothetical protein SELMODRAFT_402754 [Selaginella moellendorffii]
MEWVIDGLFSAYYQEILREICVVLHNDDAMAKRGFRIALEVVATKFPNDLLSRVNPVWVQAGDVVKLQGRAGTRLGLVTKDGFVPIEVDDMELCDYQFVVVTNIVESLFMSAYNTNLEGFVFLTTTSMSQ